MSSDSSYQLQKTSTVLALLVNAFKLSSFYRLQMWGFFPKKVSNTKHAARLVGNHHTMLLTLENALLILTLCDLFSSLYFYCKPDCTDAETQIVHQCHWKETPVLSELIQASKCPRLELGTRSSSG